MADQSDQTPGQGAQGTGKDAGKPQGFGVTGTSAPNSQPQQTSSAVGGGQSSSSGKAGGQSGSEHSGGFSVSVAGGSGSNAGFGSGSSTGAGTATARSFYDQAKETASEAYEVAAEKATSKLEEQKTTLSSGLASVANSVRMVGDNLKGPDVHDGMAKFTSNYSDAAAEKLEQVANYFEQKDLRTMYTDVENFARRNPAMFVGGAFALGLIAARFLKSSTPNQMASSERKNIGSGGRSGELPSAVG